VKRSLNYGADGYKLILERVEIQNEQAESVANPDEDHIKDNNNGV